MAEEHFHDKTLQKKEEEKIKHPDSVAMESEKSEKPVEVQGVTPAAVVPTLAKKAEKSEKPSAKTSAKKDAKSAEEAPKPKKPEFVLERKYTVNLMDAYRKPHEKRANTALKMLQAFCLRHMKGQDVRVEPDVNNAIRKSIRPLKRVTVLLKKDKQGLVYASLAS